MAPGHTLKAGMKRCPIQNEPWRQGEICSGPVEPFFLVDPPLAELTCGVSSETLADDCSFFVGQNSEALSLL